jgi:hypothetical protein
MTSRGRQQDCLPHRLVSKYQRRSRYRSGQSTVEYAILTAGVIIPVTFGIIYLSQILWIWHSVTDFTRDGARYASTHCWQADGGNVRTYMQSSVPLMIDQDQFKNGNAEIQINYFANDPTTGTLTDFSCDTECSTSCIPDAVTVRVVNYQFRSFMSYLGLQPVTMPDFRTSVAIEGAGCDPDQGVCQP